MKLKKKMVIFIFFQKKRCLSIVFIKIAIDSSIKTGTDVVNSLFESIYYIMCFKIKEKFKKYNAKLYEILIHVK